MARRQTIDPHQDHIAAENRRAAEGRSFKHAVASGDAGVRAPSAPSHALGGKVSGKLSLTKANLYKPPECVLFHDPKDNRIRCFVGPNRVGRQCHLAVGIDMAIRVCLRQAWELHLRAHPGSECPWDFGELTAPGGV